MEPNPSDFDFWIDPTALTILGCVGLVVAGLVAMVAITSWQNVRIAQATGRDPRETRSPLADYMDRMSPGEVVDKMGPPPPGATGGPTD